MNNPTLDAVNKILEDSRHRPVNSLDNPDKHAFMASALRCLAEKSKALQREGYSFSREEDYPISPRPSDKHIVLPKEILSFTSKTNKNLVSRDGKLYDRFERTYEFDEKELLDVILFVPFETLNPTAQFIITEEASRLFQQRNGLSTESDDAFSERVYRARLQLDQEESDINPSNMLNNISSGGVALNRQYT